MIIDFHSHILPAIDDGSRDTNMSAEMSEIMKNQGVDAVVATPHYYPFKETVHDFLKRRNNAVAEYINKTKKNNRPMLLTGAEVYLSTDYRDIDYKKLCISGTNVILIEMPVREWNDDDISLVTELIFERGLRVIIAHFERYIKFQKQDLTDKILSLPLCIQINASSVVGFFGTKKTVSLFADGKAHLLGSDCHGISHRPPNLENGRTALLKKCGSKVLRKIDKYGGELISGAEIL